MNGIQSADRREKPGTGRIKKGWNMGRRSQKLKSRPGKRIKIRKGSMVERKERNGLRKRRMVKKMAEGENISHPGPVMAGTVFD